MEKEVDKSCGVWWRVLKALRQKCPQLGYKQKESYSVIKASQLGPRTYRFSVCSEKIDESDPCRCDVLERKILRILYEEQEDDWKEPSITICEVGAF